MAGVGFITGTVGGYAEVLVRQIGVQEGVNKELVNTCVAVLGMHAPVVNASCMAVKEHGANE